MHGTAQKNPRFSDKQFAITLSAIFLVAGAVVAWNHEMWRDEMQAWLIARDAPSVFELFNILKRYEGHPSVWHLGLYVLQFFTSSPIIMQPYHLLIAATTIFVFARYSPFTRLQKTLFAFGYFPFYEYAIICRNYAIGILLLCLFCTLFTRWKKKFPLVALILFVLAHTSVHALIIVISIALLLFLELLVNSDRPNRLHIGIGFALILTGIITAIYQIAPAADQGTRPGWTTNFDLHHLQNTVNLIPRAFFAIPRSMMHFWNTNFLDPIPSSAQVKLVLTALTLLYVTILLLRKPTVLMMYLCGTTGLLAFFYAKYFGSVRHHGFLFMLFIAAVWISHYSYESKRLPSALKTTSWGLAKAFNIIFVCILIVHCVGGVTAARLELIYPFSNGKAVAEFIIDEELDDMLIAGVAPDDLTLEVLGYLEKDEFYYPRSERFGSFGVWDMAWRNGRSLQIGDVLRRVQQLADERREDILLVSARPLPEDMQRSIPKVAAPVDIGRAEASHYFVGAIDEVFIAQRVLSQEEIDAHYNGGIAAIGAAKPEVILAMPFEEGEGAVTKDHSPHGNRGALHGGANWSKGKFGGALTLDGTAWVEIGNNPQLELNHTDFTIALWAYFASNGVHGLIGKSEGPGERNKWWLMNRPSASPGGEISFHLNWPHRTGLWIGTPRRGEINRWHQIVLVKSGNKYNFYVDGQLIAAVPDPLVHMPPPGYKLTQIKRFAPAVIGGEVPQYCVYRLSLPARPENQKVGEGE